MPTINPLQRDNSSPSSPPLGFASQAGSVYHFAMNKIQHPANYFRTWRAGLTLVVGLTVAGANFAVLAQSGSEAAADKVTGTLDATAEREIPKGAAILVRASSGAPESQAIADLLRDALENAGYRVNAAGGYNLSFQVSGQSPTKGRRSRLELRGDRGSSSSGDVDITMRWKTKPDKDIPVRHGRRLSVAIEDAARNQVWRARIDLHPSRADDIALADAVMPALIANLGRTVYALRVP
jgi:hypothetical protein